MSIRLRLTLLYSAILTLTLVIFGVTLYMLQSESTLDTIKRDLIAISRTIRIGMSSPMGVPFPPDFSADNVQFTLVMPNDPAFQNLREREIVRILDLQGNVIASPLGEEVTTLPLNAEGLQAVKDKQSWWQTGEYQDEPILTYNIPVTVNGEVKAIIQVGRWLMERNHALDALAQTLVLFGLGMTLVAFGIGWALAGVTLRPIHRITQTAQTIGNERDFSQRVDYRGANDEVGQLATTFNSMLGQLQDSYQQVAHLLDRQRNFVADVSHELRTPLTTLQGNLALLQREPPIPPEEQGDILGDMREESERLIRLVNDLLVLARADAGKSSNREPFAVQPVVDEACRQAQYLDQDRTIRWDAAEDVRALGDRDGLKQVLLILLDNAVKYSRGEITVKSCVQGQQVEISVQDEGLGIPEEHLERIFERFYRDEELRPEKGFGLGLAIARALVEGQGGEIKVKSQSGVGTTFTVLLARAE
jgi:two-component system OmpR family sensor kinase